MTLPANSIVCWADVEKQFHKYFFAGMHEMKLTDLTSLRHRGDELVTAFIQRFREVRNKCYSLTLNDAQLAKLALQGLLPHIKEKYASQEFESLTQLLHRMSNQDVRPYEQKRNFQKRVAYVEYSNTEEETEIGLAEWIRNKTLMTMPYGKEEAPKFGFDLTKADKIFDLLLQEGQIKLSQYHIIPSADELKKIRYCKWHNATSHSTNDCKIFRQQIQTTIVQGRLKFEIPKKPSKPMKNDQHPFPTNMVEVNGKAKVLTTQSAKASGAVDPEV
jgi:hypothetical protein